LFSKWGYTRGNVSDNIFLEERVKQALAHRIKSPMGWSWLTIAQNSPMKPYAVKADGTGEAPL